MDVTHHKESQICELMCIICISIAAKKTEPKDKAPFLSDFDENFSFKELRNTEQLVLGALCWDLSFSTPYDFVHYWVDRAPKGVDRRKTIALCNEAIAKCMPEPSFDGAKSSRLFGTAAMIWACYAQEISTEQIEEDMQSIMGSDADLPSTVEQIGASLSSRYPHAYKPLRADSPGSVMNVTSMFRDECAQCDPLTGVKRPTPERFVPDGKKAKSESTQASGIQTTLARQDLASEA
jgi:hypothetical protein